MERHEPPAYPPNEWCAVDLNEEYLRAAKPLPSMEITKISVRPLAPAAALTLSPDDYAPLAAVESRGRRRDEASAFSKLTQLTII
jgi:hypothetical protein